MKKIFLAFFLLIGLSIYSHAQTPAATATAKSKKPTASATTAKPVTTTSKPAATTTPKTATAAKPATTAATAKPATTATPAKKDGTPDMRYNQIKMQPKRRLLRCIRKKTVHLISAIRKIRNSNGIRIAQLIP